MKINKNAWLSFFLCCLVASAFAQMKGYEYGRQIEGVEKLWHRIDVPDDLFGKVSPDLRDIRIFGTSEKGDTLEAPYLLVIDAGQSNSMEIPFKLLNQTQRNGKHYFTFDLSKKTNINHIQLDLSNDNFDWKVKLEGSQNQNEWFTVLDDYRLLSIRNTEVDFQHNTLRFPDVQYRYFRLEIPTGEKPVLNKAFIHEIAEVKEAEGLSRAAKISTEEDKENKWTTVDVDFGMPLPISRMDIQVDDEVDYYRPFDIRYAIDSSQTEKGVKYHYRSLHSGVLNSIGKNEFDFKPFTARKYQIRIRNHDNKPLSISAVTGRVHPHTLRARFDTPGNYQLVYGNPNASAPQYDIARFSENIPATLTAVGLGKESQAPREKGGEGDSDSALFQNKAWLWGVMALIIGLLGWFTLQMMKGKAEEG